MKKRSKILITTGLLIVLVLVSIGSYVAATYFHGLNLAQTQRKQVQENAVFSGDKVKDQELNVMLVGNDQREDEADGRSDTLMVAHYNTKTKQPKLISIMRDSYVQIPDYGLEKINAAYAYGGANLTKKVLNDSFGLPINYYIAIEFQDFVKLIDEFYPNGVTIDAEKEIDLDGVTIHKGKQVMDGNTLLQYARFRMDEEGDFGRIRRQQQVMDALAQQANHLVSFVQLPKVVGEAVGSVDTNLPPEEIISIAKDFITGKTKPLETLSVPVEGSWDFNDETNAGSVLEVDEDMNTKAIHQFLLSK
jgi:LCP family protein required for cell wall assembly